MNGCRGWGRQEKIMQICATLEVTPEFLLSGVCEDSDRGMAVKKLLGYELCVMEPEGTLYYRNGGIGGRFFSACIRTGLGYRLF